MMKTKCSHGVCENVTRKKMFAIVAGAMVAAVVAGIVLFTGFV